jgi:hypothetical protein
MKASITPMHVLASALTILLAPGCGGTAASNSGEVGGSSSTTPEAGLSSSGGNSTRLADAALGRDAQMCKQADPTTATRGCPVPPDGISCTPSSDPSRILIFCVGGNGCPGYYFPAFDHACSQDADCVVVGHQGICSNIYFFGISAFEKSRFESAEGQCAAILPSFCGVQSQEYAEDGTPVRFDQGAVAACVGGVCKAIPGPIPCGTTSCVAGKTCCTVQDAQGLCSYECAASCPSGVTCAPGA